VIHFNLRWLWSGEVNSFVWRLNRFAYNFPILKLIAVLSVMATMTYFIWFVQVFLPAHDKQTSNIRALPPQVETVRLVQHPYENIVSEAPNAENLVSFIGQLYASASDHQIGLEEVLFQPILVEQEPLRQVYIDFTVTQTYSGIKFMIINLLKDNPYVALEKLDFKKETLEASKVTSQVRLKLFMGEAS
jgi:hypothetical protein